MRAVPPGARAIFIPGNHDWGHEGGVPALFHSPPGEDDRQPREGARHPAAAGQRLSRTPHRSTSGGCVSSCSTRSGGCTTTSCETPRRSAHPRQLSGVTSELRREVKAPGTGRVVVVAAHHPLMTGGEHGGYCGATGPFRRFAGLSQDVMSGANRRMRDSLESAFRESVPSRLPRGMITACRCCAPDAKRRMSS